MVLKVLTVPAFNDNYLWLIHNGQQAVAVDPGDAKAILAALETHHLSLAAIVLTHHHADHVGGVAELLTRFAVPVYGPRAESIAGVSLPLAGGDTVDIADPAIRLQVIDVPGHTRGHIAYYSAAQHWLFCGDTMFAGGCGRLFEGTPAQMAASLGKLAALPDQTAVFCAHEYTLANLKFALEVEPENAALVARMATERDKRAHDIPTVPTSIGLEKATNPFLRYREPAILARLQVLGKLAGRPQDPVDGFAVLREWKNVYH